MHRMLPFCINAAEKLLESFDPDLIAFFAPAVIVVPLTV